MAIHRSSSRKLGLTDVVRAVAVVTFVSAILSPLMSAALPAGDDGLSKRLHQIGAGILAYSTDYDGRLPLAYAFEQGSWATNSATPTPANWRPSTTPEQQAGYAVAWANSIVPYLKDGARDLTIAGTTKHRHTGWDSDYSNPTVPWTNSSLSYNGLLHTWQVSAITTPNRLPLLWTAWGNVQLEGYVHTSPALTCLQPEEKEHCVYRNRSENAGGSVLFKPYGSMYVIGKTAPMVTADGAVHFVKLGAVTSPKSTDHRIDPFEYYGADGNPSGEYWWDGDHPWLFRPDMKP